MSFATVLWLAVVLETSTVAASPDAEGERRFVRALRAELVTALQREAGPNVSPVMSAPEAFVDPWPDDTNEKVLNELADRGLLANFFPKPSGHNVSEIYRLVLSEGESAARDVTAGAAKLREAKSLLFRSGRPENGPSPTLVTYRKHKSEYDAVTRQLENEGLTAAERSMLKNQERSKRLALETLGRKNEIEAALATVQQLSPSAWWRIVAEESQRLFVSGPDGKPLPVQPSDLIPPPNDWTSDHGWTRLRLDTTRSRTTDGGVTFPESWGLWTRPGRSDERPVVDLQVNALEFELRAVAIQRKWFDPVLFRSAWRWRDGRRTPVSDGGKAGAPAAGLLPCVPTHFLLARDVRIRTQMSKAQRNRFTQILKGGPLAIGPFLLSGPTGSSDDDHARPYITRSVIAQPSVQLVGMACDSLPELPRSSTSKAQ